MPDEDNIIYNPDNIDDYSKKQLAKLIFTGVISRQQVDEDGLFRPNRKLLDEELERMAQEDRDWTKVTQENTSEAYQRYLALYNPKVTEDSVLDGWKETVYIGRHVDDAKRLKALADEKERDSVNIQNDNEDWASASDINTIESYSTYIRKYDVQPPQYRGQYVDEAKLRSNKLTDEKDWAQASKTATKKAYSAYLSVYDKAAPNYIGAHVSEAKHFINQIQDEEDWSAACESNALDAYKSYLSKYDVLPPHYRGKYVANAEAAIEALTKPADPLEFEEQDWNETREKDTISAYSSFINTYEKLSGKHVEEAKKRKFSLEEEIAWNQASQANTIQSYRNYLSLYQQKNGQHVKEALAAIEALKPNPLKNEMEDWAKAMRADSVDGYQEYISKYEHLNGQYVDKAKLALQRLLDESAWQEAVTKATVKSYRAYLDKFEKANGAHVQEAKLRICQLQDEAAWIQASTTDSIQAYKGYLKQFDVTPPAYRGRYIEDAKRRIANASDNEENRDWLSATKVNTIDAYQHYLNKYESARPQGKHVAEAKRHIMNLRDEEAWAKACKLNTKEAYEAYIRDFTKSDYKGKHLAEAKRKLRPIHWNRLIWLIVIAALGWFLWIQWVDGGWPFNMFQGNEAETNETLTTETEVEPSEKDQQFTEISQNDSLETDVKQGVEIHEDLNVKQATPKISSNYVHVKGGVLHNKEYNSKINDYEYHDYPLDDFYIHKFELTQGEYKKVVGDIEPYNYTYESLKPKGVDWGEDITIKLRNDSLPIRAKYIDFAKYCNKLSVDEGYDGFYIINGNSVSINPNGNGYRLPTGLEWTFAAKGGNLNENYKHIGGDNLKDVAWYGANSGNKPHVVGKKKPNGLGLYDMAGNLPEFLETEYSKGVHYQSGPDYMLWQQMYSDDWWSPYCVGFVNSYEGKNALAGCRIVFIPKGLKNNNVSIRTKNKP